MIQEDEKNILTKYRTVAVVGLSRDPSKASYLVAAYLKDNGFKIVPVNPSVTAILGEKSYKSLADIPSQISRKLEIIDIFRPASEVTSIVEQAVKLRKQNGHPFVIWMQLGIANEQAAEASREAGMEVIMDKCIMQQHRELVKDLATGKKPSVS